MAKITKIEVQKRNKERVNLFLDDEYAFSISTELVYKEGLKVNLIVDIEKLKDLAEKEEMIRCKNSAIRIIERNHKTEKEIRNKLIEKGYNENAINNAIDFLKRYNFLNDNTYTKMYVRDKLNSQGSNKIKYALMKKGISREMIEEELENIDKDDEKKVAMELAKKKLTSIKKSENDKYKISGKLYRFLISKGYNYDIVKETVKDVMSLDDFD